MAGIESVHMIAMRGKMEKLLKYSVRTQRSMYSNFKGKRRAGESSLFIVYNYLVFCSKCIKFNENC